jgi:hypothetical protein
MLQVKVLPIDDFHNEYGRANILIFSLILDELNDGLFCFLAEASPGLVFAGDVHEPPILVAADEVDVVVVLEKRVAGLAHLSRTPHRVDVLLDRAVSDLLTAVLPRLQGQKHLLF